MRIYVQFSILRQVRIRFRTILLNHRHKERKECRCQYFGRIKTWMKCLDSVWARQTLTLKSTTMIGMIVANALPKYLRHLKRAIFVSSRGQLVHPACFESEERLSTSNVRCVDSMEQQKIWRYFRHIPRPPLRLRTTDLATLSHSFLDTCLATHFWISFHCHWTSPLYLSTLRHLHLSQCFSWLALAFVGTEKYELMLDGTLYVMHVYIMIPTLEESNGRIWTLSARSIRVLFLKCLFINWCRFCPARRIRNRILYAYLRYLWGSKHIDCAITTNWPSALRTTRNVHCDFHDAHLWIDIEKGCTIQRGTALPTRHWN